MVEFQALAVVIEDVQQRFEEAVIFFENVGMGEMEDISAEPDELNVPLQQARYYSTAASLQGVSGKEKKLDWKLVFRFSVLCQGKNPNLL